MPRAGGKRVFDLAGSCLLFISFTCLLFALNQGVRLGWKDPLILSTAAVGATALCGLCAVERRAECPILDPAILSDRMLVCTVIVRLLHTCAYMAVFIVTPFFLEDVLGLDALHTSWILLLRPGSSVVLNFAVGFLSDKAEVPSLTSRPLTQLER